MEFKTFSTKIVDAVGDDERTVTGLSAIMGVIDHGMDQLFKGAFNKTITERKDRVKHLWQHDFSLPPIASIVDLKEVGRTDLPQDLKDKYPNAKGGLLVKRRYLDTPRGNEVLAALKSSPAAITEMSFGYDAVKFDFEEIKDGDFKGRLVRNLREVKLWDTSDVNWGMNEATVASVKSVPMHDTGTAPIDQKWVAPLSADFTPSPFDELDPEEKTRLLAHFGWTSNTPPQSFDDYLFPHHEPSKSGVGPAVLEGVIASMDALMQADPGIPMEDRKSVYDHLAKHFEQFGKAAPDYEIVKLMWSVGEGLKFLDPTKNEEVHTQLKALESILRAEPKQVPDLALLTQQNLTRQLEFRKRQLELA